VDHLDSSLLINSNSHFRRTVTAKPGVKQTTITSYLCDYHFIRYQKTWKDAQKYCTTYHTDLATVSNKADMKRLMNAQYPARAWIGLQKNAPNIVWRWSQPGVKFNKSESEWFRGQPDIKGCVNGVNHQICAMMNHHSVFSYIYVCSGGAL
uniref:C-type lectin domain-containing protein n=1 Tax=Sander lucioperca TaxID=283035 RepID=A0A8C9ZP79_SANLU